MLVREIALGIQAHRDATVNLGQSLMGKSLRLSGSLVARASNTLAKFPGDFLEDSVEETAGTMCAAAGVSDA